MRKITYTYTYNARVTHGGDVSFPTEFNPELLFAPYARVFVMVRLHVYNNNNNNKDANNVNVMDVIRVYIYIYILQSRAYIRLYTYNFCRGPLVINIITSWTSFRPRSNLVYTRLPVTHTYNAAAAYATTGEKPVKYYGACLFAA